MSNQPQSLISYGDKVQYGLVQKNEREMRKNATNEFDENDPECKRSGNKPFELISNCPDCGEPLTYRKIY